MDNFFNFRKGKMPAIKVKAPDVQAGILIRLGKPKFWVSNNNFNEVMEKIYKKASSSAIERYQNLEKI